MAKPGIYVNTRNVHAQMTGVQRYTRELLQRLEGVILPIAPQRDLSGLPGHVWEQVVLPSKIPGTDLLWSPSNSGPVSMANQVVTIHDMAVFDVPENFTFGFRSWYQFLVPQLVKRARRIIAVSQFTKSRILHHCDVDEEKIVVIQNGVGKLFKAEGKAGIEAMRQKLGIPTDRYVLVVGSIEPRKNLRRLLGAWKMVADRIPGDVWLIVTGGQGRKPIFPDVYLEGAIDRVYRTDYVADADLRALYSGAICSVFVPIYEGFGLPPLEAMACGTPTLTANTAALPEILGTASLMVDPYDVKAIADGLERMIEDCLLRDELRQKGLGIAASLSWEITAQKTLAALRGSC